ncbi:DUF2599 domain-containing protein [bacterium]|nr:MAG: DUF2599 domain-containing protein [bacterium]
MPPQKPLYINSAKWKTRANVPYLEVIPTTYGRSNSREDTERAFSEALQLSHTPYSQSLYDQFECHANYPGLFFTEYKESWNLDDNAPEVSWVRMQLSGCNP